MNKRFRRELVLARLRQRREEMAAAAVGIQGKQLEETVQRVHGLNISPAEACEALQSLHSHERGGSGGVGSSSEILLLLLCPNYQVHYLILMT